MNKLFGKAKAQTTSSPEVLTLQVNNEPWFTLDHTGIQAYRWLHTYFSRTQSQQIIGLTSALLGEGVSYVARRLAAVLALDNGQPTLLVDTSLSPSKPNAAPEEDMPTQPGLAQLLEGQTQWEEALQPTSLPNLHWLAAGAPTPHPTTLLRAEGMSDLLATLRQRYRYVLVDMPPVLADANAIALGERCDGLLWVVRAGLTPIPTARRAISMLPQEQLLGVVINGSRLSTPRWVLQLMGV